MKFGPVPVDDAAGSILAHSLGVGGKRLKKGRILTNDDVNAIKEAGLAQVTVAAWMASPGHRRNILNGSYRQVGTGMAIDPGGRACGNIYLTQNFTD